MIGGMVLGIQVSMRFTDISDPRTRPGSCTYRILVADCARRFAAGIPRGLFRSSLPPSLNWKVNGERCVGPPAIAEMGRPTV